MGARAAANGAGDGQHTWPTKKSVIIEVMKVSEAMQEGSASLTMTQASAATLPQVVASLAFAISAR